jgi:putative ATP-dependent endonuclease of OLD family
LNLIVGENDSGKTAIIDAIKLVLLTHSKDWLRLEIDDFHLPSDKTEDKDRCKALRIECHFRFDSDAESKNFLEWSHFNKAGEYELRIFLVAEHKDGRSIQSYDVRGGIDEEGSTLDTRARDLLRITYLQPLRDAKSELTPKRGSRLSQILDNHKVFAEKDGHFLTRTIEFANNEITNFFDAKEPHHSILQLRQFLKSTSIRIQEMEKTLQTILNNTYWLSLEKLQMQNSRFPKPS